jgi:hypothetical protein
MELKCVLNFDRFLNEQNKYFDKKMRFKRLLFYK